MDQSIVLAWHGFFSANPALAQFVIFFAHWFPYLLALCAAVYAFVFRGQNSVLRSCVYIFLPTLLAWIVAEIIKIIYPVARPFEALHFTPLISANDSFDSFPSGHATFFAALGVTIFLRNKKIGSGFLLGALLIGLARIAAGVHFPGDILAGFLLGGLIAYLFHRMLFKYFLTPLL